ncbi:MAG TPA: PA0069 family radical SAM protein [Crenotrichaceae bacterium]|nr:PA0069 family radical SAM protein [Crenotrichaceae bacterium]
MRAKMPGRGSISNPANRYHSTQSNEIDDGWNPGDEPAPALNTTVSIDNTKTIINPVHSPDLPFDRSINPYRGCEHGCIYCYARPSHAYLDFSPGLDFESRLIAKPQAAELLRKELDKESYQCKPIAMGTNTDPYQPIDRKWQITRQILDVLSEYKHPVSIVTKASLIERDLDILTEMAGQNLVLVLISISSLDRSLTRFMEPRAAAPQRRLKTIERLRLAGIPVGVLVAPIIPFLNDSEIERVLKQCQQAGAYSADYVMLRLPLEVETLFQEWLKTHYPLKANRILQCIRELRCGKLNDSTFGQRMRGQGAYADLISQRFRLACKQLGLNTKKHDFDCTQFRPTKQPKQIELF